MTKRLLAIGFALLIILTSADAITKLDTQAAIDLATYSPSSRIGSAIRPQTASMASSTGSNQAQTTTASEITSNWAGYVATGHTYTAISGSWTVPSISTSAVTLSADAAWIGIGGTSSNDLIQVGTVDTVENGQNTTSAFYEELPDAAQNISSIAVDAGDTMSASITETSTDDWAITIQDLTNGEAFTQAVYYDSSESSAEWIEEAPSDQSGIMALDDFGAVNFSDASTTEDGQPVSLTGSDAEVVGMDNQAGEPLVDISSLDGSGFMVTRTDADSDSPQTGGYYYGNTPGGSWRDRYSNPGNAPNTSYPSFRNL